MCTGLKEVIDGAINRVQANWYENYTTEHWGFFVCRRKTRVQQYQLNHIAVESL